MFWHDCWLQDVALKVAYDDLYLMVIEPEATVEDYCMGRNGMLILKDLLLLVNLIDGLSYAVNFQLLP